MITLCDVGIKEYHKVITECKGSHGKKNSLLIKLECPNPDCRCKGNMNIHSTYSRRIAYINDGKVVYDHFTLYLAICTKCGKCQSLQPYDIVAFREHLLQLILLDLLRFFFLHGKYMFDPVEIPVTGPEGEAGKAAVSLSGADILGEYGPGTDQPVEQPAQQDGFISDDNECPCSSLTQADDQMDVVFYEGVQYASECITQKSDIPGWGRYRTPASLYRDYHAFTSLYPQTLMVFRKNGWWLEGRCPAYGWTARFLLTCGCGDKTGMFLYEYFTLSRSLFMAPQVGTGFRKHHSAAVKSTTGRTQVEC